MTSNDNDNNAADDPRLTGLKQAIPFLLAFDLLNTRNKSKCRTFMLAAVDLENGADTRRDAFEELCTFFADQIPQHETGPTTVVPSTTAVPGTGIDLPEDIANILGGIEDSLNSRNRECDKASKIIMEVETRLNRIGVRVGASAGFAPGGIYLCFGEFRKGDWRFMVVDRLWSGLKRETKLASFGVLPALLAKLEEAVRTQEDEQTKEEVTDG